MDHYKLLLTVICYFWRPYTTFDGYILLLTAIYHIWWLYITFDGYILLLTLRYCNFTRIQVFPAICFLCGLNTWLEFNINLLALIHFSFFCNSMVSPINFNLPFWKHCFIRNTQMLKCEIFRPLKKRTLTFLDKKLDKTLLQLL